MGSKRNCFNCAHLEWWSGEPGEATGFICEKRDYQTVAEESKHLAQLENKEYLERAKKCNVLSANKFTRAETNSKP